MDFDGVDKTGEVNLPITGSFQTFTTFTIPRLKLEAGVQVMRLNWIIGTVNLNYIELSQVEDPFGSWAEVNIPAGLDRSFAGDTDADGIPNGAEYVNGSNPNAAEPGSIRPLAISFVTDGLVAMDVALENTEGVTMVIERSTDLATFEEVYRNNFDTDAVTATGGFAGIRSDSTIIDGSTTIRVVELADEVRPAGKAFYRVTYELNQ